MFRYTLLLMLAVAGSFYVNAQSLYMPRDITQAFKKGTRAMDGQPGKNY